jgi:hypothetical protein
VSDKKRIELRAVVDLTDDEIRALADDFNGRAPSCVRGDVYTALREEFGNQLRRIALGKTLLQAEARVLCVGGPA